MAAPWIDAGTLTDDEADERATERHRDGEARARRRHLAALVLPIVPDWYADARCRHLGAEVWLGGEADALAARVCDICPVRASCEAASADEVVGVWAGITAAERRARRRAARAA